MLRLKAQCVRQLQLQCRVLLLVCRWVCICQPWVGSRIAVCVYCWCAGLHPSGGGIVSVLSPARRSCSTRSGHRLMRRLLTGQALQIVHEVPCRSTTRCELSGARKIERSAQHVLSDATSWYRDASWRESCAMKCNVVLRQPRGAGVQCRSRVYRAKCMRSLNELTLYL